MFIKRPLDRIFMVSGIDGAVYFCVCTIFEVFLDKGEHGYEPLDIARSAAGKSGHLRRL